MNTYYTTTTNGVGKNLMTLNTSTTYYNIDGGTVQVPFSFRDFEEKDNKVSLIIQLIKILVNKNIYFRLITPGKRYKNELSFYSNDDPLFNIEFIGDNPRILITCSIMNDDFLIFSFDGDHKKDFENFLVVDNSTLSSFENEYISKVREVPPSIDGGMGEVLELVVLLKQLYSGNFRFVNIIKENNEYTVLYAIRENTYYFEHIKVFLNQNYSYDISLKVEYKAGPQVAHSSFILHEIEDKIIEKCFKKLEKSLEENIKNNWKSV